MPSSIPVPERRPHESREVPLAGVKVSGAVGDPRVNPWLRVGDEAIVVMRVRCKGLAYTPTADPTADDATLRRDQSTEVIDGFVLSTGANAIAGLAAMQVADAMNRLRAERRETLDDVEGNRSLFGEMQTVNGRVENATDSMFLNHGVPVGELRADQ